MNSADKHQSQFGPSVAGLCADCSYSRKIESARGAIFCLCERSASDTAFAKYPRLPVLQCSGYAPPSKRNAQD
jgi:hypothetical protein